MAIRGCSTEFMKQVLPMLRRPVGVKAEFVRDRVLLSICRELRLWSCLSVVADACKAELWLGFWTAWLLPFYTDDFLEL